MFSDRSPLAVIVALAATACASKTPAPAAPAAPPAAGGVQVEKTRQQLEIAPLEVVFSGVRGETPIEEAVAIRNTGKQPLPLNAVSLTGPEAATFMLISPPRLPMTLVPGAQVVVTVAFAPAPQSAPGVHRSTLRILIGPRNEDGPPVDLSGLVLAGKDAAQEPPLTQVAEALGFAIDVGGGGLRLGVDGRRAGEELAVGRFQRANRSPVSVYPVARFSGAGGAIPYGYYHSSGGAPERRPLAVIAETQQQTLNPDLEPDGKTTFDPGEGGFGLFLETAGARLFTDAAMNSGAGVRHAARVFPLTSRAGGRIADACLIAFELGADGDYQDVVFVMWNVKAVP